MLIIREFHLAFSFIPISPIYSSEIHLRSIGSMKQQPISGRVEPGLLPLQE